MRRDQVAYLRERSLWLHRAVAERLAVEPDAVLARARDNLGRLRQVFGPLMPPVLVACYEAILDSGVDGVHHILTADVPWAAELRVNSPFVDVLDPEERRSVLAAFAAYWWRDGAGNPIQEITHYAIVDRRHRAADDPAGMARRVEDEHGMADERLRADMRWHRSGIIAECERGEHEDDLVEIPPERVQPTIDRLRERWRAAGVLDED